MYKITFLSALQIFFTEISHIQTVKEKAHAHRHTQARIHTNPLLLEKRRKQASRERFILSRDKLCFEHHALLYISFMCRSYIFPLRDLLLFFLQNKYHSFHFNVENRGLKVSHFLLKSPRLHGRSVTTYLFYLGKTAYVALWFHPWQKRSVFASFSHWRLIVPLACLESDKSETVMTASGRTLDVFTNPRRSINEVSVTFVLSQGVHIRDCVF